MEDTNRSEHRNTTNNLFVSLLMRVYIVLIGAGLPLFVRDKYFDILVAKYYYYCICTIVMILLLISFSLFTRSKRDGLLYRLSFKKFFIRFTWVDYSILTFYVICVLSTLTSDYVYESFWGNEGRFTGLFLITLYVISYFCISRFWKFESKYVNIILCSGILVCIFGITDYFNMDIFRFKAPMLETQRNIFTSTIGNINTYTAYVGIIVGISAVLFINEKKCKKIIFYFVSMVLGFYALILGVSDNAYLSLGALFAFLPLYIFKTNKGIKRYIIVLATFFSVILSIGWINTSFANKVIGIDSSFQLIIGLKGFVFLIIGLWVLAGVWYFIDYINKNEYTEYSNLPRILWVGFLIVIFIALSFMAYDCNIAGNSEKYGSLRSYLLFNDDWGSHRGYIWRIAMECYTNLPPWKKIVGYGPETFGILVMEKTADNSYGELFDSAHNEYLHLLTTVGLAGLLAYISFIIGIVYRAISRCSKNSYIMAVVFGIICYSVQALVNLNLPIVTPVFWILLGIASAKSLKVE